MLPDFLYYIIISPIEYLLESAYTFLSIVVRYNPVFPVFGISVLVSLCCLPLYAKAESIQAEERFVQKRMKKKIASIKKHFKGDEQYMILSMYYRENHYHPLMALRSSLSLLVQIPFFIAAYHFLSHLESLKGAFFWLIRDLGSPDGLVSLGGIRVNILPIIMTLINIVSGYIYAKDYELKEKLQLFIMALIFLVLLYNSPAALVLYWTFNNIFSLAKNCIYKNKKPGLILYIIILLGLASSCIFVFFFRSQGRSGSFLFKASALGISLFIAAVPLYIKAFNYLGKRFFSPLKEKSGEITALFYLSSLCLWLLCSFIIPFNVISSDTPAFSFLGNNPNPFSLVLPSIFTGLGFFVFWPGYIFMIFSKKIKIILSFLFFLCFLTAICNSFGFLGNPGTISETLRFHSESALRYTPAFIFVNFLVTAFITLTLIYLFKEGKIKILSTLTVILLIGGLLISIWKGAVIQKEFLTYRSIKDQNDSINITKPDGNTGNYQSDTPENSRPIFNLTRTGKNVVVIMLDRAVGSYLPLIFKEKPELDAAFSGFVYYPNMVSFFRSTILGAPPIFGGYEYIPEALHERKELSMAEKNDEALLVLPTLFMKNGYEASVYDLPNVNYQSEMSASFFLEKGINAETIGNKYYQRYIDELKDNAPANIGNNGADLKRNFLFFSLLTVTPPVLRKIIYKDGSYWASMGTGGEGVVTSSGTVADYASLYYMSELTSFGEQDGSLILLVNNLTHSPSFLQYPDYTIAAQITDLGPNQFNNNSNSHQHYHVNAAAYLLLARWFEFLRENGVYDNTRIIIVSDHDEYLVKPLFSDELRHCVTIT
jgi:YidC/Oxa1 family membrane protein insertase